MGAALALAVGGESKAAPRVDRPAPRKRRRKLTPKEAAIRARKLAKLRAELRKRGLVKVKPAKIGTMTKVVASADPKTLEKNAKVLAAAGYKKTAAVLRKMAAKKQTPIVAPAAVSDPHSAAMNGRAALLATHLRQAKPGAEDRKAVRSFQATDGTLTVDGLYGPKTAMRLAHWGAYPPPTPRYWPRKDRAAAKAAYAAWLKAAGPVVKASA